MWRAVGRRRSHLLPPRPGASASCLASRRTWVRTRVYRAVQNSSRPPGWRVSRSGAITRRGTWSRRAWRPAHVHVVMYRDRASVCARCSLVCCHTSGLLATRRPFNPSPTLLRVAQLPTFCLPGKSNVSRGWHSEPSALWPSNRGASMISATPRVLLHGCTQALTGSRTA